MHNYSENWRHLKSILTGYSTRDLIPNGYSYVDHKHAKALAIFLTNATLGTPKLDRPTIEALLTGRQHWPNTRNLQQVEGIDVPLSFLEENGFVSFFAGWCTVHCQSLTNPEEVDPSLTQLIQAIEYLKDICYGRNDYIQPHFTCPADKLQELLATHFGNASVAELLPKLELNDGHFVLLPSNQNFDSLVSTNLWINLRETLTPKAAFEHWMLCLRVNMSWCIPLLFDNLERTEQSVFNEQLLAYLSQDSALSLPMDTLWKQSTNQTNFSGIVMPVETHIQQTIDANGNNHQERRDIKLEKTNIDTLSTAYQKYDTDDSDDLELVRKWQRFKHWRIIEMFYTGLLAKTIEASIWIERQSLASSGFTESLLEIAKSRPVLKHMLFHALPEYENFTYKIFLLSLPNTCDIALFYLAQHSFSDSRRESHSFTQHLNKGYQQLVCHEFLRTIDAEPDSGGRLFKIVELLGERCDLRSGNFSENVEYQFLLCLLESLDQQRVIQLAQVFAPPPVSIENTPFHPSTRHYWYLIGFWLIESLEDGGIDHTGKLIASLKTTLLNYYKSEFEANLEGGNHHSLQPNDFFSALPWHKLIGHEGVNPLLKLSNSCGTWQLKLSYSNQNSFSVASAIRHYLQLLMSVGRPQRIPQEWMRVANRVLEIVRTLGFNTQEEVNSLFDSSFHEMTYDLWKSFCSYTNLLDDTQYVDFIERYLSHIPLNQQFVLLECCTVIARQRTLQNTIATRKSDETEELGLTGFEQAFISAWNSDNFPLATKLLNSAKSLLTEGRLANSNHPHILKVRKLWLSYEYKLQLMTLLGNLHNDPTEFESSAIQIEIPNNQGDDNTLWHECERFRRYIIANAYLETDPGKCVRIMEALYKESRDNHHNFMLFKGRVADHKINNNSHELRHTLTLFLDSLGDADVEYMPTIWIASILDVYKQLKDYQGIDEFWMSLSSNQQVRGEILHPYCEALIARGDTLTAQKILNRYREMNQRSSDSDELGITDLIDELCKSLPQEQSMSQFIQLINEGSQRTTQQLRNHYNQIISKEFEEYVAIVGQGIPLHDFLKNIVLELAEELLLRKKNLQLHQENSQREQSFRITSEDLINDWFTSLFDKRMAEARIGLRDQKRGGKSASGKSPGEIDGFIADSKNKRHAIFEAFRLFYLDTTVIAEHLNKISVYDNESLSPVFIAAYCDVGDFDKLVCGYTEFINKNDYSGYAVLTENNSRIEVLKYTDQLWLGMESRHRNTKEIIFYHLLLNMR